MIQFFALLKDSNEWMRLKCSLNAAQWKNTHLMKNDGSITWISKKCTHSHKKVIYARYGCGSIVKNLWQFVSVLTRLSYSFSSTHKELLGSSFWRYTTILQLDILDFRNWYLQVQINMPHSFIIFCIERKNMNYGITIVPKKILAMHYVFGECFYCFCFVFCSPWHG